MGAGGGKKSWKEKAAGGEASICCSRHNCPSPLLLLLLLDFFFLLIVLLLLSSSVDFLPGILIWWNLELRCKRLQGECWESMIPQQECRLPASAPSSSAAGFRNLLQAAVATKLTKWVFLFFSFFNNNICSSNCFSSFVLVLALYMHGSCTQAWIQRHPIPDSCRF